MINKTNIIYTIAIAVISMLFVNNIATAQTIQPTKIAVVDTRLINLNSAVAQEITRQVNQIRTQLQSEITATENDLKAEDEELKSQSSIMAPEAYAQKAEEFQKKVVEYQRELQTKNAQLEFALNTARGEVERALKPIYQTVLKNTGATMLIDKSMILEQAPGIDVTTMIIELLDLALPSVIIELPESPAVAADVN